MKHSPSNAIQFIGNAILTLLSLFLLAGNSYAVQLDKNLSSGQVRVHYPSNSPNSCDAILMGVGTAMARDAYDNLSNAIIKHGYVVVILDHAPGNPLKTDADKYANLAEDVKSNLLSWLRPSNCKSINHWVMGGHSAGGQAAQNAVADNQGLADAVFSIDPYNAKDTNPVYVPALYWGFAETTCFVEVNDAAKEAYNRSKSQRAFFKVAKKYSWGPCGYSPKFFHCSFCDSHCPACTNCTNCTNTPSSFFTDVALSVKKFINAAFYGNWSKSALAISSSTPVTLYVDTDKP